MILTNRAGPAPRDDALELAALAAVPLRPVFILGLHRSGTTFLYGMLARALPVALLTAHHVVDYDRLLVQHREGSSAGRRIEELIRSWDMPTRGIDEVPLSHDMPEEYGWILRRRAGSFHITKATAPVLAEIIRKLQALTPTAEAVLLKNPWDAGYAAELLAHWPQARFIFLSRNPLAIVNSQFRIATIHGRAKDPYLDLLLEGIPFGRAWVRTQSFLCRALGPSRYGRIALAHILRDVGRELGRFEASRRAIPRERRLALDYSDLIDDAAGMIEKVAAFLGISLRQDLVGMIPRPRNISLLPEVAAAWPSFLRRLHRQRFSRDE